MMAVYPERTTMLCFRQGLMALRLSGTADMYVNHCESGFERMKLILIFAIPVVSLSILINVIAYLGI